MQLLYLGLSEPVALMLQGMPLLGVSANILAFVVASLVDQLVAQSPVSIASEMLRDWTAKICRRSFSNYGFFVFANASA